MSNFRTTLTNLLKARFPYLYITTWEEDRISSIINSMAADEATIKTTREVFTWTLTNGIATGDGKGKEATKTPLKALEFVEKHDRPSIFVFKDFHIYLGENNRPPEISIKTTMQNSRGLRGLRG